MRTPAERARSYRDLAEEIRTAAEGMRTPQARHTLLNLAESYDVMARGLELDAKTPAERHDKKTG